VHDRRTIHREDARDGARVGRERGETPLERVAHGARQRQLAQLPSAPRAVAPREIAAIDEALQHLPDEERVAARPVVQQRDEIRHGRRDHVEGDADERGDVVDVERVESHDLREPDRERRALGGHPRGGRRLLVRRPRPQQHHASGGAPREEVQQLQRGRVAPLQVVGDEQERRAGRERVDELRAGPEEARLELSWIGGVVRPARRLERGKDRRQRVRAAARDPVEQRRVQRCHERPEHVADEEVRDVALDRVRGRRRHPEAALAGNTGELHGDAALSDAALADDERRGGRPVLGGPEERLQAAEHGVAPDAGRLVEERGAQRGSHPLTR
jgi:hypothetical protein